MNRRTQSLIRKFKTTTGEYLWEPPVNLGAPATLIGAAILSAGSNLAVLTIPAVRQLTWRERLQEEPPETPVRTEGPIGGPIELD